MIRALRTTKGSENPMIRIPRRTASVFYAFPLVRMILTIWSRTSQVGTSITSKTKSAVAQMILIIFERAFNSTMAELLLELVVMGRVPLIV